MFTSNAKVLIVDDSPGMQKLLTVICKSAGFTNLTLAGDGQRAWEMLGEKGSNPRFDFIISDYTMPHMNGLELLKLVRASDRYSQTPFLVVTAESQPDLLDEIRQAGVSAILNKPFTSNDLVKTLDILVAKKAA